MALASTAQALYLFVDGATQKCFYEELPKGTLVSGHYSAEEFDDRVNAWQQHEGIKIYITVDVRSLLYGSYTILQHFFANVLLNAYKTRAARRCWPLPI